MNSPNLSLSEQEVTQINSADRSHITSCNNTLNSIKLQRKILHNYDKLRDEFNNETASNTGNPESTPSQSAVSQSKPNTGSLLDDYASFDTEMPNYFGGQD